VQEKEGLQDQKFTDRLHGYAHRLKKAHKGKKDDCDTTPEVTILSLRFMFVPYLPIPDIDQHSFGVLSDLKSDSHMGRQSESTSLE
jgi:hypothetical protein